MGQIRRRGAAEVRERAITQAMTKHDEGCEPCAAAYLQVARANGATEADIRRAGMGRRGFLKFALATLAATGAATLFDLTQSTPNAKASLLAHGTYVGSFGVDSCTPLAAATAQAMPLQFYVGEVGATQYGLDCFDAETAAYVGREFTHGYWGLCGPNDVADPAAYGRLQAELAVEAMRAHPAAGALTLFADVETGFGGWGDPATPERHAALLDAWLKAVAAAGYIPGVYINDSSRDAWFPPDWVAAAPFVYWVAGGQYAGTMCAPCQPDCDTLTPVQQLWDAHVSRAVFGGYRAVLWQYWLSDFGCAGDFIFSPQSAYRQFTPVSVADAPLLTTSAGAGSAPGATPTTAPAATATPAPTETPEPRPIFQPTPSMG